MRILNIYLKNLNSLEGEWFIDLEHPRVLAENLFLISGPTGSGKSTLLDAICLALYGRTPRLANGKNSLSIREICSRHTSESIAEVTFETAEGRFVAHWRQKYNNPEHRAKPDKFIHSIRKEGEKELSSQTSRTREFIENITGLSYSEFTRAMLLAQGDFASFLKASRQEKGALLEKLAETAIYRNLSKTLHSLKTEANEEKKKLKAALDLLPQPQSGEQNLAEQLKIIDEEIASQIKTREVIQNKLKNLETLERAREKCKSLQAKMELLKSEQENFAPSLQRLETARKLQDVFALERDLEKSAQNLTRLSREFERIESSLRSLATETAKIARLKDEAAKSESLATQKYEEELPRINQARNRDEQIARACDELGQNGQSLQEESKKLDEIASEQNAVLKRIALLQKQKALLDEWLTRNNGDAWLVENLGALEERFKRLDYHLAQIYARQRQLSETSNKIKACEDKKSLFENDIASQEEASLAQEKEIENADRLLKQLLGQGNLEDLRKNLRTLLNSLNARRLAASFEEQRSMLVEGEACPLCGSIHHPWQNITVPPEFEKLEKEEKLLEKRIEEAEQCQDKLQKMREKLSAIKAKLENAREKVNAQASLSNELKESVTTLAREIEVNENERQNFETSIKKDLEPLGLSANIEIGALLPSLVKRREKWLNQSASLQEIQEELQKEAARLASLDDKKSFTRAKLDELSKREKALNENLASLREERFQLLRDLEPDREQAKLKGELDRSRRDLSAILENELVAREKASSLEGARNQNKTQLDKETCQYKDLENAFTLELEKTGLSLPEFNAARMDRAEFNRLSDRAIEFATEEAKLVTMLKDGREEIELLEGSLDPALQPATLRNQLSAMDTRQLEMVTQKAHINLRLEALENSREERKRLSEDLARQEKICKKWDNLYDLIGSHDGSKFVDFVQNVTLSLLVRHANRYLELLKSRYKLDRSGTDNLGLTVIDTFQANEQRPVGTLSGGETFLISLALALGLSSLSGRKAEIGSLFLDEGFGTLDNETLGTVMDAIYTLRDTGRMIGVISHVEQMKDIDVKLEVHALSGGRSELSGDFCSRIRPA